jgi:WD40 repeat protein
VKIWEAETQKNTKTLSGLTDQVYSLALSPDGKLLAAGDYNGEVRIWNLADGKLVKGFNASPGIATISKK